MDRAALAANEGYQDEAVTALRSIFEKMHLNLAILPQLPWFRSLEGHPGYAELLAERQRRIDQARTEMRALEAKYPDSEIVKDHSGCSAELRVGLCAGIRERDTSGRRRLRSREQALAEIESIQERFPDSVITRMIRTAQAP